jgi:Zn-dependent protease with chaperone function
MPTALRAPLAVLLLAGCYAVAGAELLAVVAVVLALLQALPTGQAVAVAVPLCIAPVGALAYSLRRTLRLRHGVVTGVPVARADAPGLWSEVDRLAAAAAARTPDDLTVVADACVTVVERTRLLGLVRGRRRLVVGLPVLQALDVDHLRALLVHELAHDSRLAGRWAPAVWRGRHALDRTVGRTRRRTLAAYPLRGYARLVRRATAPVLRDHELAADRLAASVAGGRAAAEALRDLPMLAAAQQLFHAEYLGPGWQAGHVPDDIFGGLLRMLAARADDLARWRVTAADEPDGVHPPTAERLAALAALPPRVGHEPDPPAGSAPGGNAPAGPASAGAPAAGDLVPDLPGLGRALQALVFPPHGRSTVGWDEFFGAARTAEMEREADAALRALSRAVGAPVVGLAGTLDLAAADGLLPAVRTVFPELTAEAAPGRAAELVTLLLALAALSSGAGRWRHSWTGTAELVAPDGGPLDLGELADLAVRPDGAEKLRHRLGELGIHPEGGGQPVVTGGPVVGGLVNLGVDGGRADLLVLDAGLLVVPGLPRSRAGEARQRLARLAAADDAARHELVPGIRFVRYADVVTAAQVRRTPKTWQFELRGGVGLQVRAGLDSDELAGGWVALQDAVAFLNGRR